VGVDLSPGMLEMARPRQVYDDLIAAELTAHLESVPASCDLIASADTLVYFGDLKRVLAAAAGALRPGGLVIFTVEKADPDRGEDRGFFLQYHGRFCHTEKYVRETLIAARLSVRELKPAVLRMEAGKPVAGLVVTARKDDAE
jgi:predicted TPR repeat methyltransferase